MVMLAKYLLIELSSCHPRVIIVTDRKELDRQIAATFSHTRLNPARAISGRNLVDLLQDGRADVITTIINKFNTAESWSTRICPGMSFSWWTKVIVPTMDCWLLACARSSPMPATSVLPAHLL